MTGREYITPEVFHKRIDIYACPEDYGFETEYMRNHCCTKGNYHGDCKKCWDSTVIKTNCIPDNPCIKTDNGNNVDCSYYIRTGLS